MPTIQSTFQETNIGLAGKETTFLLHNPKSDSLSYFLLKSIRNYSIYIGEREVLFNVSIVRAERDGTSAETRFRLCPKRTSPFKSVGASVNSTAGSRGVRISLSNAG